MQIGSEHPAQAWKAHVRGVDALLRLRGDTCFWNAFSSQLYWGAAYNHLIAGFRGFIPDYRLHPIQVSSGSVLPLDLQFFNIVQSLPLLRAKAMQFAKTSRTISCSGGHDQLAKIQLSLVEQLNEIDLALGAWLQQLESQSEPPREEASVAFAQINPNRNVSNAFASSICFANVRDGFALLLYWTIALLGLEARSSVQGNQSSCNEKQRELALRIGRSLEWFLRSNLVGFILVGFPLSVSRQCLARTGSAKDVVWFCVIDEHIRKKQAGLSTFLGDLEPAFFNV
jgi:hypothetical protein